MILGGGTYQVPLIKKAKEMGLYTIVVSIPGNYPGIALADKFLPINTTDVEGVLRGALAEQIDGIVTTGTDVCVPAMGKVVDEMHLPGTGYEAACRSMDKVLMKECFRKNGVRTAEFENFVELEKALSFATTIGFPVMVKAPDSSGSRGITKVNEENEFKNAFERAKQVSRSGRIIIERYLSGIEFGAQALVKGSDVVAVFPHGDTVTPPPYCSPIGHSIPAQLSEEQLQNTKELVGMAVHALGIRDCVANVDLILVDGIPYIIEIGARMGATCLPENVSIYAGQDIYEYLIRTALGESPQFITSAFQANACLLLRSQHDGIIIRQEIPDEVKNHPAVKEIHFDYAPGDSVRRFVVGPDRIGHIIVTGKTAENAEQICQKLASKIIIEVR